MRKILITGATGLIGSHLMSTFGNDDKVYAISRDQSVPGATKTLNLDLGKLWSRADMPKKVDIIVHLAQSEQYRDFPNSAEDVFKVNTLSTVKLLDYARDIGVQQFVLASSGGIYGTGANSFSEDEAIIAKGELGFYIGTRLCSEMLSECYSSWMNVISLRFFFAYGEGQRPNMLIPRLVESVKTGKAIHLKGETGLAINPIHVSDAAKALSKAMLLPGSYKINVAGSEVLTLRSIAEIIGEVVGKKPLFDIQPSSINGDMIGDISRMKSLLCEPRVGFNEGVSAYLKSLQD